MASAGGRIKICEMSDLEDEEIFLAEVDGVEKLAVYIVDGEVFATSDTCTHGEASLAEDGYVEGHIVTCSWHDGAFDIRNGEVKSLPCNVNLKTYPVTVEGDDVFVTVD